MEIEDTKDGLAESRADGPKQDQSPEAEKAELKESQECSHDDLLTDYQTWNAIRLQAWWRMIRLRRAFSSLRQGIVLIQTVYKECPPSQRQKRRLTGEEAKARIWRCWVNYRNCKAFQNIRDILYAHQHADPKVVLASLALTEASLMDKASGLHVRLRLGGLSFPPQIFFKIFTHRPVTDVGAFAPRNYDLETKLASVPTDSDGNPKQVVVKKCLWYQRHDNNSWRPILPMGPEDETLGTMERRLAPLKRPFEHCHYKRRQALVQEAKDRKRAWLRQMYAMGRQQEQQTTVNGTDQSCNFKHLEKLSDDDNGDALECFNEWGEEELLRWTENLDFEAYQEQWASTATLIPDLDVENIDALLSL